MAISDKHRKKILKALESSSNDLLIKLTKDLGPTIKENYKSHFNDEELEFCFIMACTILYDRKAF